MIGVVLEHDLYMRSTVNTELLNQLPCVSFKPPTEAHIPFVIESADYTPYKPATIDLDKWRHQATFACVAAGYYDLRRWQSKYRL